MLCLQTIQRPLHSWKHHNPQFYERVSNFKITNKRLFSIAVRMFKPDRCYLTNKRFEALVFINCNKDFKQADYFSLINI